MDVGIIAFRAQAYDLSLHAVGRTLNGKKTASDKTRAPGLIVVVIGISMTLAFNSPQPKQPE